MIKEALKKASLILKSPKEASILLQYHLGCDQVYLLLNEDKKLKELEIYEKLVQRRLKNEPIEYITNEVSFYSRIFFIKEGALIPRPETEILVDLAVNILKKNKAFNIAEIGTGSGIISIMLAILIDDIKITATDISKEALEIAMINAYKFGVEKKIEFIHTSYLDGIYDKFDMIISNPPYIANDFNLEKSLDFEPKNALFGGEKGDEILKNIIDIWINSDASYLLCEIGYDQKEPLTNFLIEKNIKEFSFYKDLSSLNRGFIVQR